MRIPDGSSGLGGCAFVKIGNRYSGSFGRQCCGDGAPDPICPSGNDGTFILEAGEHQQSFL
jgi:hypothetical protein